MNNISILTQADFNRAFEIERASHAFPWNEKTFASNQGERYLNLKLEQQGKIVGFAIVQTVIDEASLFNIAIDPAFQRQGLGRMLLEEVIAQLQTREVLMLWLEVRASNRGAIALYQSLGFNEVTVRRNYYPATVAREDAIIMALLLG